MKRQLSCDSHRTEEHFKRTKGPDGAGERPGLYWKENKLCNKWRMERWDEARENIQSEKAEVEGRRNKKDKLYLHGRQLNGGDVRGVNHRLGPVGSVRQQALPLLRQPGELLLPRVEARVDAVLKVRWGRDLQPFLLLPKHAGKPWKIWKTKWRLCITIVFKDNETIINSCNTISEDGQ